MNHRNQTADRRTHTIIQLMMSLGIITQEEWDATYHIELNKQDPNDPKRERKAKRTAEETLLKPIIADTFEESMQVAIQKGQIDAAQKNSICDEAISKLLAKNFMKMPDLGQTLWKITVDQYPEIRADDCRQWRTTAMDPQKLDFVTILQSDIQAIRSEARTLTESFDRLEALTEPNTLIGIWLEALREFEIPPELQAIAELKSDAMFEGRSQIDFDRLAPDYNTTAVNLRQRWHRFQSKVMKRAEQLLAAHRAANP